MEYVALEWDHKVGRPPIRWIVVNCAAVGRKFGGPQALPPRKDIAYFLNEQTAERDAKLFAEMKNLAGEDERTAFLNRLQTTQQSRHAAFGWDHKIFSTYIQWAVLQWSGDDVYGGSREDVAYFLDSENAEEDAKAFCVIREYIIHNQLSMAGTKFTMR